MGLQQAPTQTFATVPPGGQGIYEYSTTPKARLGQRMQVGDREFVYAKFATTIPQGYLVQAAASVDSEWEHKLAAPNTVAAGTNVVTVSMTAGADVSLSTAHEYDDGYLYVTTDPTATVPGGYMYQIKQQLSTAATSQVKSLGVQLYDNLVYTVATGQLLGFIKNPYKDVTTCGKASGPALGVVVAKCVTSGTYGWIQNKGPACVFVGSKALEPFHQVCPSVIDDGAVDEVECTIAVSTTSYTAAVATAMNHIDTMLTRQIIGVAWGNAGVDTEASIVLLNI